MDRETIEALAEDFEEACWGLENALKENPASGYYAEKVDHARAALARLRAGLAGEGDGAGGAEAMREAAAKMADDDVMKFDRLSAEEGVTPHTSHYRIGRRDEAAQLAKDIRALPLPPGPGAAPPATKRECEACSGSGVRGDPAATCQTCGGMGSVGALHSPADPAAVPGEAAMAPTIGQEMIAGFNEFADKLEAEESAATAGKTPQDAEPVTLLRAARDLIGHRVHPYAFTTGQKFKPGHHCRPDCLRCKIEAYLAKGPQQ